MIVLSIYIATFNRRKVLKKKIEEILSIPSQEFDIWVLDDCSNDGTYEMLQEICDYRLHSIQNTERMGNKRDGAMPNWYQLLEKCDGKFALHLNDRDLFYTDKLLNLIDFLKAHPNCSAGICDSFSKLKFYETPEAAFYNIPYKGSHPSGIIFRMDLYKKILNREQIFTKEKSYIHPHDLILGELSKYGRMFRFYKIFGLADKKSFAENKSFLYKKGDDKTAWFAPGERLKEFELFLSSLNQQPFSQMVKKKKAQEIAKCYLYFCTFNYKFYITDEGQTKHYGIKKRIFTRKDMFNSMKKFLDKSSILLKNQNLLDEKKVYERQMTLYFWFVYYGRPFWNLYKKGIRRKW